MKKLIILIIGVLVVGGILVLILNSGFGGNDMGLSPEEVAKIQKATEMEAGVQSSREAIRYENSYYGFSFEKPEGYTVGAIPDGLGGETILVQNATTNDFKEGFQIYIYTTDEAIELTPQLIQSDLPGTVVRNAQKISLDGASGMMFESNNDAFGGSSYEIWLIAPAGRRPTAEGGLGASYYVFQISSYASFANQLQGIIGTWKF